MQRRIAYRYARNAFAGVVAAVLALSLAPVSQAWAEPTANEKQAEAHAALISLNSMQTMLNQASIDYDEASRAQGEAEAKRDEAQVRIVEANDQISSLQDRLCARARSMYRTGGSTMLDILFGATTYQAFASNWDLLTHINQEDARLVEQTKNLRSEIQEQKAAYAESARVANEKADEAARMQDEAASTMAAMQATYDGLNAETAELLEQERAAQQAVDAANAQSVVEASIQQAEVSSSGTGTGTGTGIGTGSENGSNGGSNGGGSGGASGRPDTPPAPVYNPSTGNAVVDRAYGQLGKAYGYDDPSYGVGPNQYDCSGFVSYCLSGGNSRLGSTRTFMNWPIASDPQPGDVAVKDSHCGIYIGNGQMIHSATYGVGVIVGPVQPGMIIVRPW